MGYGEMARTKVTKVSCNEKIPVQVKCKQPKGLKIFQFFLSNFLNFWIIIYFEKKIPGERKLPLKFFFEIKASKNNNFKKIYIT